MNKPFKNIIFDIAIALAIAMFFISDQALKYLARSLPPQEIIPMLTSVFDFRFTPNYYIAFSIPLNGYLLNLSIIAMIGGLCVYLLYLIRKKKDSFDIICLAIMASGAISNLIDRLSYGYVIDYLYLSRFTVFNLADMMISGGALVLILRNLKKNGSR
jgi:signal peptidase II